MHSSDSGYERHTNDWLRSDSEVLPFQPQAFRTLSGWRPVEDAVSALVCHGALSRFPTLKVAVVENGSSWVAPLMKNLADVYKKMPQDSPEEQVEVVERDLDISPFWEITSASWPTWSDLSTTCSGPIIPTPRAGPTRSAWSESSKACPARRCGRSRARPDPPQEYRRHRRRGAVTDSARSGERATVASIVAAVDGPEVG